MRSYSWLACIPPALYLAAVLFADRIRPFVFGLPFFMAWIVGSVVMTSVVMWLVYRLDPANGDAR